MHIGVKLSGTSMRPTSPPSRAWRPPSARHWDESTFRHFWKLASIIIFHANSRPAPRLTAPD
jgi:hypothetical protein